MSLHSQRQVGSSGHPLVAEGIFSTSFVMCVHGWSIWKVVKHCTPGRLKNVSDGQRAVASPSVPLDGNISPRVLYRKLAGAITFGLAISRFAYF